MVIYVYRKNIFGDITEIYQGATCVAKYKYDAWGNCTVCNPDGTVNASETFIGNINPFRYRGYYWDNDLQLYYLQTRYYDPSVCRFISPDSHEYLDPETFGGLNLYAYCNNNPINNYDPTGHSALLLSVLIGAGISFLSAYIPDVIVNFKNGFEWSDFNTFTKENLLKYTGAIIGGAIGGLTNSLIGNVITGAIGNIIEESFAGNINSFNDFFNKMFFGAVFSFIGEGLSEGITRLFFANKKYSK